MIPLYCLTTQANTSEFELLFNQISDVTDKYVNLGVSILGVTFNILSLLVLMDLNLTHNFYDFLRCRCVCNLTVCTIGLLYASFGDSRLCGTSYGTIFVSLSVLYFPLRNAYYASVISDNLLILNRLLNLFDMKGSLFFKLSKKVIGYGKFFFTMYTSRASS